MPRKYRVNAEQVQVVDIYNNFANDNVEEVLAELKRNITIASGGFAIFVNEVPNVNYNFFQDPNMIVSRSSNEIDVVYNNTEARIEHKSGVTAEAKTTSFFADKLVKSPFIEINVAFPDSTGVYNLIFNKNGDDYYKIRAGWGNGVRLYRTIDGIDSLIYHYTNVLFNDNSKNYTITLRKINEEIDVRVNGVRYIAKDDYILDDIGMVAVESVTEQSNKNLYLNYIKFGELAVRA